MVAVGLLAFGVLQGSDSLLVGSVSASLLGALALIVGGRRAARTADDAEAIRDSERVSRRPVREVPAEVETVETEAIVEPVEELVTAGRAVRRTGGEAGGGAIPTQPV